MRYSKLLASDRVKGVEDDHLGRKLVRHVVPLVLRVVVYLEDLVGHSGENFVYLEEILVGIDALWVEECQGEVSTGSGEGFPDAMGCPWLASS